MEEALVILCLLELLASLGKKKQLWHENLLGLIFDIVLLFTVPNCGSCHQRRVHHCGLAWIFFTPPCRGRCAGLLGVRLIYASGQIWVKMKHPTRWLLLACCSFFFFIPFALSSFQSSAQRDCVSLLHHSQVVCVCVRASACVYICAMRRDKRLHPPLRRRIPQRSATRSV